MGEKQAKGSMYLYDATNLVVIDAANQYHAIQGFLEGSFSDGITFLASSSGVITNTSDNGGVLRCTDALHGLTTGQYITLTGMGDVVHVGRTQVTVIDANTFDCDDIGFNSIGDTGNWQRGSCLTIDSGHGGDYSLDYSASFTSSGNSKNYKIEMSKNALSLDEFVSERKVGVANDLGNAGSGGLVALEAGDCIYMTIEGTTDATNLTIEHANVHLTKS